MSDFFGKLKSGAEKVAFEAEKMNRLNRAKGELEKVKTQIQAQYLKLGEMYYTQRATTGVTGSGYDEICQAIMDLEHQVEAKNEDIQRINAEVYAPQVAQSPAQPAPGPAQAQATPTPSPSTTASTPVAAATSKFCPNCGKEMALETKFCPDCGTKV
jgi:zinc-ribbon domain